MPEFRISNQCCQQFVTLPASFILDHMPSMKGDYLKLYLYLVYLTQNREIFSLPALADLFECGERDLLRGLSYLKRVGLIDMETDEKGEPLSLALLPVRTGGNSSDSVERTASKQEQVAEGETEASAAPASGSVSSSSAASAAPAAPAQTSAGNASGSRFSRKLPEMPSPAASEPSAPTIKDSHASSLPYESYLTQNENGFVTVSSSGRRDTGDSSAIHAVITGHTGNASALKVPPTPMPDPESKPHLLQEPNDPEEAELVVRLVEEHLLNRPMTVREAEKTMDYYMMLNQNLDLTIFLFEYYIEKKGRDHVSFAYLDKIARDWKLKGYKSDKEPRKLLSREKKDQARTDYELAIRVHLGIDRIVPGIEEFIDRWMYEYKIPLEALIPALDCAAQKANSSLQYADKILKGFHNKNVRTAREAYEEMEQFSSSFTASREGSTAPVRPKKTSMHNFTERKEEEDSFEDLIQLPRSKKNTSGNE